MRIPSGLFCFVAALAIGACDDSEPVPSGESGAVSDDDGEDTGPDTEGPTSATTTGVTMTDTSGSPTGDPTTTPTPTTMDPTEAESSSSGDPTTSGCTPGTQGCACDEGECVGGLMCVAEVCTQAVECGIDIYEDNNTEADAADLGMIGDDDDEAVTITAVLEGDEVDWFTYLGQDNLLSSVNPSRDLTTAGALRMCKFVECVDIGVAATEVTCPEGTASAESPEGRPGCCGDDTFEIELNCDGVVDDDARVWIRFDQGLTDCTQFTLEYHY